MHTHIMKQVTEELGKDSIEDLVHEYNQKIYVYCYNILRNAHDAEDAAQEVFIKALQSNNVTKIENKSAWLYKIAYNHCLNKIKRKSIVKFLPFSEANKEAYREEGTDFELNYILSQLKPKERALIVLRIIEDKDFAEIANILEVTVPAARKRFERIKSKIQLIIKRRNQYG